MKYMKHVKLKNCYVFPLKFTFPPKLARVNVCYRTNITDNDDNNGNDDRMTGQSVNDWLGSTACGQRL